MAVDRAWSTTSPSEWPLRRGASEISIPPNIRPSSGPNPCVSSPNPKRALRTAPLRRIARTMSRSSRSVTLMLVASPGTVATETPAASRRAASSVYELPAGAREGIQEKVASGALRRLRPDQAVTVDRCTQSSLSSVLERVDDRHRGHGGAVFGGSARHGVGQRARRQWPRAVVHEHDVGAWPLQRRRELNPIAARHRRAPLRHAATLRPRAHRRDRRRVDHDHACDRFAAARIASTDQASSGRPKQRARRACRSRPCASCSRGDDDRVSKPPGGDPFPGGHRGWAKTMRPATVWRTRTTVTSISLS